MGYALPALLAVLAVAGLADLHGLSKFYPAVASYVASGSDKVPLGEVALAGGLVWSYAVFLLGINYALTRMLEGYGRFNPARLWRWHSLARFRKLTQTVKAHNHQRDAAYSMAAAALSETFPESEDLVLPTRFGNILRAAERYPQTVYSMEAISLWYRLQSAAATEHMQAVADSKAALDFWINLWFAGIVVAGAELALFLCTRDLFAAVVLASAAIAVAAAKLAQSAASDYGTLVKATFDLYRGELCAKLGLLMPKTASDESDMWQAVSRTALFRDRKAFADLDPLRK